MGGREVIRIGRRPLVIGLVMLVAAAGAVSALVLAGGKSGARALPVTGHARRIGALDHGNIRFALNLRLQERKLAAYLKHVRAGHASGGGLTASEFGARFGPSNAQLARLRAVLRRLGITVARFYPQRTTMLVRASVPSVDRLFALRFDRYALPDGQRYFAPEGPPSVPQVLLPYVSGLGDLSDQPIPAQDIPGSGLTPAVTAKAYDIAPLWNAGIRGQGQTIAIATAFGAVNPADLQAFAQRTGTSPQIAIKQIDGGSTYNPHDGSDREVDLDLQVVAGVAPDARIIDYQGSDGSHSQIRSIGHSLADLYNQIEQDGLAKIVTTSYGLCESRLSPGDQPLIDNSLKALEASNVTVFESSGDSGAFACIQGSQIQPVTKLPSEITALSVQSPASTPYAVTVGGTRVELRSDGSYLAESAWSQPLEREGGGGGISASEPRPSWQQGPGVLQPSVNPSGRRQVPDVAGPADPSSGFMVCNTPAGASAPTCKGGNGGTSAAAPFWAASMLLVQQYGAAHGAGALTHCFAGPILYDLAAKTQPVPAFHQVTFGNNGWYNAGPGWNFATGLGSPDVFNLAQDYANFLRGQSPRTCPF
jgi:subtilase family serine protease